MKTTSQQKPLGEMSNAEFVRHIKALRKARGCLQSDAATIKRDYTLFKIRRFK